MYHEMRIYLKDSQEEMSVACVAGDFPLWIDLGYSETIDTHTIEEALETMLNQTEKATRNEKILLYDGGLPKTVVELLYSFGKRNHLTEEQIRDQKYYDGCETDVVIYIGSGDLEAFTRAKLQLCIITCFFNQEVSNKLLETLSFDDEYLAKLEIRNTNWEENGEFWIGDLNINRIPSDKLKEEKLKMFSSLQEERKMWYRRYTSQLEKAEKNGMVIKTDSNTNILEGIMDLFELNERQI